MYKIKNIMKFKSYKNWLNESRLIKVDNYDLPIVIVKKEDWPEGKNDPTEFDSDDNVVRIRSDYDYKKDPLNWMKHELIHYLLYKKGSKDDGKEYPTNNTERVAYTYQFKKFKRQGIKKFEDLPDLGKKQHEKILKKYWEDA